MSYHCRDAFENIQGFYSLETCFLTQYFSQMEQNINGFFSNTTF